MSIKKTERVMKQYKKQSEKLTPVGTSLFIPNYSGLKDEAKKGTAVTHTHTGYLSSSEVDEGVGLTLTGDNSSTDTAYVPMVLYNTDATPPAANTTPIGTIYIQYTP